VKGGADGLLTACPFCFDPCRRRRTPLRALLTMGGTTSWSFLAWKLLAGPLGQLGPRNAPSGTGAVSSGCPFVSPASLFFLPLVFFFPSNLHRALAGPAER